MNTKITACKSIIYILLLLSAPQLRAQRLVTIPNTCGLYYRNLKGLLKEQAAALAFYNFTPGDTIASVGAQACNWEAAYCATKDSLFFYLEDIDTFYCNTRQANLAWQYYQALISRRMGGFSVITGNEQHTALPPCSCNKILIINSFHEFTYPGPMLHDVAGKLKQNGVLYIDEQLAEHTGQLHNGCGKPLRTEAELIQFVEGCGYTCTGSATVVWHKKQPLRKIFAFTQSNTAGAQTK